jgi:molybdenum cofactor cytidylyltransferase
MKLAAVIVAAGQSSRFGPANKLMADMRGRPLISHAVEAVMRSALDDAVIVIAPDNEQLGAIATQHGLRSVVNAEADEGLSSSIKAGITALSPDIDGAMIVLGDMPSVSSALIGDLVKTFASHFGSRIVFPLLPSGRQGNPVVWPRRLFPELMTLTGDVGGKRLIEKYADLQAPLRDVSEASQCDVDTIGDLSALHDKIP